MNDMELKISEGYQICTDGSINPAMVFYDCSLKEHTIREMLEGMGLQEFADYVFEGDDSDLLYFKIRPKNPALVQEAIVALARKQKAYNAEQEQKSLRDQALRDAAMAELKEWLEQTTNLVEAVKRT